MPHRLHPAERDVIPCLQSGTFREAQRIKAALPAPRKAPGHRASRPPRGLGCCSAFPPKMRARVKGAPGLLSGCGASPGTSELEEA